LVGRGGGEHPSTMLVLLHRLWWPRVPLQHPSSAYRLHGGGCMPSLRCNVRHDKGEDREAVINYTTLGWGGVWLWCGVERVLCGWA
jgi:hypothetical protein